MDFNVNHDLNENNHPDQTSVRARTAFFGPESLLDNQQLDQTNTQQNSVDSFSQRENKKIDCEEQSKNIQQKSNNDVNSNSNQNNISSMIPNMFYGLFGYLQQSPPQQENQQQQKQEIKTNQIGDFKQKSKSQKHKLTPTQQKQKLKAKGIEEQFILNGEKYKTEIQSCLKIGTSRLEGNLILTNYKLVYIITGGKIENYFSPDFYHIQLMLIQNCERQVEKKGDQYSFIEIQCKDVRKYQFRFKFEQNDESFDFMTKLVENIFFKEKDFKMYPAISYKKSNNLDQMYDGWNIYNAKKEFQRMKIQIYDDKNPDLQNQYLYKYLYNEKKEICETYPPILVVPNNMPDVQIKKCSKFRSKERLPVLTFAYRNKADQIHTLWRCSQCKTGFINRSAEDEMMLRYIGDPTENKVTNNNINLHIYDARPFMNAVGNKFSGKGFENTSYYKNCEIQFLDIHNIHKVRDSFNKVITLCQSADLQTKWFREIDQTQWLDHIQTILFGAVRICDSMENHNILVHCSDGWDRTSQLCCLTQIFLDPYYRTIEGFSILVEKDWVLFGHQFNYRQGHGIRNQTEEFSPIFLQFLDCVHQLLIQYPLSFEFNEQFLVDLAFSSYNCMFGTFMMNFYQEQVENNIMKQTNSVWSWIKHRIQLYLNPTYDKDSKVIILKPDFSQRSLQLWKRFFLYYQPEILDQYQISQSCRFNEDNILNNYKKALEKLQYYETLINAVDPQFQNQKVSPLDFAQRVQNSVIEKYNESQQQTQKISQQQLSPQQEDNEIEFLTTSTIQREIYK